MYVYFYSLHVSGSHVPFIRRINCINTTSGICQSVLMTVWCTGLDESQPNLHTKRSSIQSDIYQMSYWYKYFSWWWANGCPKHVEKTIKHTWKRIVRQIGYFQRLYRDARSTENKTECSFVWTDIGLIFTLRTTEHVCLVSQSCVT